MTPIPLRRRMMERIVLISCLAVNGVSSLPHNLRNSALAEYIEEPCPPCELLFSKLERTGRNGKLAQDVRVQERGEPKSGTGFMYFWASATLMHTCKYLQGLFGTVRYVGHPGQRPLQQGESSHPVDDLFRFRKHATLREATMRRLYQDPDRCGKRSCWVDFHRAEDNENEQLARYANRSMIFEPALGGRDSRCSCDSVDRVSIVLSRAHKHTLPVDDNCTFSHGGGIGFGKEDIEEAPKETACTFPDGTQVQNHDDLWRCMHQANCAINDDWLQMAVFRDPRPAVVSTFFHLEVHGGFELGNLEEFVTRELPILCQWVAVRYILFAGLLDDQSFSLWYNDAMEDPLGWHYQWFYSVGLQLPLHVVEATARAAAADDLGFSHKDIDLHPGEVARADTTVRRFEDEVSSEIVEIADAILRTWLPPVLLDKIGIVP